MSESLPAIEIETAPDPRFSVLWLHGLGADGNDFVPLVPELGLPSDLAVRFVFPHAAMIPVTCNNGYVMRAWYDIHTLSRADGHADEAGIRGSREVVRELIARENARGVPSERIVLAGFSQGGAMAYLAGLTHPQALGGIVALSAYLPAPKMLAEEATEANRATPVFVAHGTDDPVLPLPLGELARDVVKQYNSSVSWHTYPMPHSVCQEEITTLAQWLAARFAK